MNRFKLLKNFILFFPLFLFISCGSDGNDEDGDTVSSDCTLKKFSFTSVNTGVTSEVSGVISNTFIPNLSNYNLVLITVPESCDVSSLKASFSIHEKATLSINEVVQISGQTAVNYTNLVTARVVAEGGQQKLYDVVVKKGDPVIDTKIYTLMKDYSIPGVSVSVSKNDDIIYSYGYGFANVEMKEKVTPNHLFRLASISKQFTTICLMTLYEQGLLGLDDKVFGTGGILAAEFSGITGTKADVTIKNFLQHNSGWTSNPNDPQFDEPYRSQSLDEQIKYMLSTNQKYNIGEIYSYYNLGFSVIGKVIAKISGKSFEEYLKEVMLSAGITDVHVGKDRAGKRENECIYYSQSGTNGYGNNMPAIAAAGGIIASSEEMMKLIVQVDGKGADILKPQTCELMYTPSASYNRYGLGWRLGHSLYPGAHYHSGNVAGTATIWCGDTNDGISAVILMNSRSYKTASGTSFDDAYYILLGNIVAHFANS